MGSANSRFGLRKFARIAHSDFEGKHEDEALENKTRQAHKQSKTQDSTQANSIHSFHCFGQKNKTGLKEERRQTRVTWHHKGISINARAKHNVEEMRIHEMDSAERILDMEAQIRQLKHEKNHLLSRLSEIGAVRLLDNNPDLADLSDANRPEKLMEQFAEIYDNEWTYAFEYLIQTKELQDKDAIKELLRILQVIYRECLSASRKHSEKLKKAIARFLGLSKQKDELVIKETEKRLKEYRGKNHELNITQIGKTIKKRLKGGQIEDKVSGATDKYIQACTRVCWLMCIKEPQMHLHFGDIPENDHKHDANQDVHIFDTTQFVSYTKTGMYVKYVVWPALFLYKDGPIMKKGVAQGSQGKPTKYEISADNKDGDEHDNSVKNFGDTRWASTAVSDDGFYAKAKH
ncbi:hypothetical protein CHS0354_004202 [Potamilus streckersoni]|uniref:Mitochondria-eating protein n=1 Tax=Potamilus streckersoni TaxID=2493646 RepID=A0AAE0VIT3_9BIVA|nr:hypothetical protein CHS0354_004202 [Potamilus streckersoni]